MNTSETVKHLRKIEDLATGLQQEARLMLSQIETTKPRKQKQVSGAVLEVTLRRKNKLIQNAVKQ